LAVGECRARSGVAARRKSEACGNLEEMRLERQLLVRQLNAKDTEIGKLNRQIQEL
jgi:hypothetical protein